MMKGLIKNLVLGLDKQKSARNIVIRLLKNGKIDEIEASIILGALKPMTVMVDTLNVTSSTGGTIHMDNIE